jgi:predicted CoA-binding protein
MTAIPESVADFLAQKRIAVAGVSRSPRQPANAIYRKLRDAGYQVFPINPRADEVEGDHCYPSLSAVDGPPLDGVVVVTAPNDSEAVVRECAAVGVPRVWIHRSFGEGSVSQAAVQYGKANGIDVIEGGCPMMYCDPVDMGHKCMRWVLRMTRKLPS